MHCAALQGVKRADRLLVVLEDADEGEATFRFWSEDAPQGQADVGRKESVSVREHLCEFHAIGATSARWRGGGWLLFTQASAVVSSAGVAKGRHGSADLQESTRVWRLKGR